MDTFVWGKSAAISENESRSLIVRPAVGTEGSQSQSMGNYGNVQIRKLPFKYSREESGGRNHVSGAS